MGESEGRTQRFFSAIKKMTEAGATVFLFLDEATQIMTSRASSDGDTNNAVKDLLLSYLDGPDGALENFYLLASCNRVWTLDEAFRSRMETVYVKRPSSATVAEVFFTKLDALQKDVVHLTDEEMEDLGERIRCKKYSMREVDMVRL